MHTILIIAPLTEYTRSRYAEAADELGMEACFLMSEQNDIKHDESIFAKHRTIYVKQIEGELTELVSTVRSLGSIDAILAGGEFTVAASDYLARSLGLNCSMGGDPLILRNKAIMRRVFNQYKVPQPKFIGSAHNLDELRQLISQIKKYPIISKPADMAGSWNVAKNHNCNEIERNAAPIFSDKMAFGFSFAGECVLEEFVGGDEYSAEIVVKNSEMARFFITRKFVSLPPYFDEIGHLSGPDLLNSGTHEQVKEVARRLIKSADVRNSVVHMEFKLSEDQQIAVIEAGCRIAGDRIPTLVESAFGFNLEKAMILTKLGMDLDLAQTTNYQPGLYGVRFTYADIPQASIDDAMIIEESMLPNRTSLDDFSRTHFVNRIGHQILNVPSVESFVNATKNYCTLPLTAINRIASDEISDLEHIIKRTTNCTETSDISKLAEAVSSMGIDPAPPETTSGTETSRSTDTTQRQQLSFTAHIDQGSAPIN